MFINWKIFVCARNRDCLVFCRGRLCLLITRRSNLCRVLLQTCSHFYISSQQFVIGCVIWAVGIKKKLWVSLGLVIGLGHCLLGTHFHRFSRPEGYNLFENHSNLKYISTCRSVPNSISVGLLRPPLSQIIIITIKICLCFSHSSDISYSYISFLSYILNLINVSLSKCIIETQCWPNGFPPCNQRDIEIRKRETKIYSVITIKIRVQLHFISYNLGFSKRCTYMLSAKLLSKNVTTLSLER